MSPARIWAIIIVALLHVVLGFALVYGLYASYTKTKAEDLETFDVAEEAPPEEEPPPPEQLPEPVSPQIVSPPPLVRTTTPPPPTMQTTTTPPPAVPFTPLATPPRPAPVTPPAVVAPPPPPPPPPPAAPPTPATQTGGSISNADYPASAIRASASGTTRVSIQIGANGRVTGCSVTGSSGNGALDSTACSLIQRRFRYRPATRNGQAVASTTSRSIRWDLPRE